MRYLSWRLLLASPLILLAVLFALSNTAPARVGLWPTDLAVEAPLSLLVLVAMAIAFLLGALATWFVGVGARLRARRAEQSVAALRAEIQALTARLQHDREPAGRGAVTILPPATKPR
jgi:uncharacterized integral membrane protein